MFILNGQNVNTIPAKEIPAMNNITHAQDEAALRQAVQEMLTQLFAGVLDPAQCMTEDYVQHTDGKRLEYSGFVSHLRHVRNAVREVRFQVLDASCNEDTLADRHVAEVHHHDGRIVRIEVYLFAKLAGGKIRSINEVTRSLDGSDADRALAHAQA